MHVVGQERRDPPQKPDPTFRTAVDLVSADVIVRNRRGQFQADSARMIRIFEDGVKQEITSFTLVHGGRVYQAQPATVTPVREGIVLPLSRPVNDAAGRIIIFVIDDLHLDFRNTPRLRTLFRDMAKVTGARRRSLRDCSTGTSSIAIDLTYDRTRMEEAANRITGGGRNPPKLFSSQRPARRHRK